MIYYQLLINNYYHSRLFFIHFSSKYEIMADVIYTNYNQESDAANDIKPALILGENNMLNLIMPTSTIKLDVIGNILWMKW